MRGGDHPRASVGDQVELNATRQAGVPLHKEPRGTNDFQRVPDGTKATVIDVAQDGRWMKLSLPAGRIGWVSPRYVGSWALLTLVGNSADSPEPLLRPSPATGHDADMLDVEDPNLGDDAETVRRSSPNSR
jgi:hypothetical protein